MRKSSSPERGRLPPRHLWLINPDKEKIETPTDDRGIVLVPELIDAVKSCVDESWDWRGRLDKHHFYWPRQQYYHDPFMRAANPSIFRNLSIHKGLVPRPFHDFLHKVTLPPSMPSKEVMGYRVEAYNVAKSLFEVARISIHRHRQNNPMLYINGDFEPSRSDLTGSDYVGEQIMRDILSEKFTDYERRLRKVRAIPEEFRLIDVDQTTGSIYRVATELGRLLVPTSINLVKEIIV